MKHINVKKQGWPNGQPCIIDISQELRYISNTAREFDCYKENTT